MDLSELQELLPEVDIEMLLQKIASGGMPWEDDVLQELGQLLLEDLRKWLPRMLRIVGVSMLCAGLTQFRGAANDNLAQLMQMLAYLCIAIPIAQDSTTFLAQAGQVMQRMNGWCDATLPTMIALLSAVGGEHSALAMQRTTLLATDGILQIITRWMLPLLKGGMVLMLVDHLSDRIKLGGVIKSIRSFIHWALGGGFTVFMGVLTVRSTTGTHYDGVTLRAAKYAIDKAIPVVGGVFKDTADTLIGCSLIVKNALGVVGLTGILLMLLKPCLALACAIISYKLCAAALEPLGCTSVASALQGFADLLTTLMILLLGAGAMFFILLSALMRIGMGFV